MLCRLPRCRLSGLGSEFGSNWTGQPRNPGLNDGIPFRFCSGGDRVNWIISAQDAMTAQMEQYIVGWLSA